MPKSKQPPPGSRSARSERHAPRKTHIPASLPPPPARATPRTRLTLILAAVASVCLIGGLIAWERGRPVRTPEAPAASSSPSPLDAEEQALRTTVAQRPRDP